MQSRKQEMTALPPCPHFHLKINNQPTLSRSKCKFWAPTLVSKLNPFLRPRRLAKFSFQRRKSPLLSTINAWFTNLNVICVTQIRSGTPPDNYTSTLTNTNTLQSGGILSNTVFWRLIWLKAISVLKKCKSKFDCLIFEMLLIKVAEHSFQEPMPNSP